VLTRRLRLLHVSSESGVGMIELLVGMIGLALVVAAWSGLMTTTVKTNGRTQELSALGTEVRAAIDMLSADLRQALCNGTTTPVTTSTGTQLTFYSPDRATPFHLRQISYRLSGGQLERAFATSTNTDGPPWTIPALGGWAKQVGSVTNTAAFTYKDANGASTTNPTAVASVNVVLTVAPSRGLGGASSTNQTNIQLRTSSCNS
jgi:Tfp pilus assembly protein PilW